MKFHLNNLITIALTTAVVIGGMLLIGIGIGTPLYYVGCTLTGVMFGALGVTPNEFNNKDTSDT